MFQSYVIQEHATLSRTFRLFRTLGLRHLCVVDDDFGVVGIITRHEMTEHHMDERLGEMFSPHVANNLHAPRRNADSNASSQVGGARRAHHFIKNLDHSESYRAAEARALRTASRRSKRSVGRNRVVRKRSSYTASVHSQVSSRSAGSGVSIQSRTVRSGRWSNGGGSTKSSSQQPLLASQCPHPSNNISPRTISSDDNRGYQQSNLYEPVSLTRNTSRISTASTTTAVSTPSSTSKAIAF